MVPAVLTLKLCLTDIYGWACDTMTNFEPAFCQCNCKRNICKALADCITDDSSYRAI